MSVNEEENSLIVEWESLYIPIIIEDNHGNKRELELNVRAEFVRTDVPSIDIDNNINIDNY